AGFIKEACSRGLGDRLAADDHLHWPRRINDIATFIRVARMDKNFVVFREPVIDPIPIKGDVILERGDLVEWLGIAPHGILGNPVADRDAPIGCCPCTGSRYGARSGAASPSARRRAGSNRPADDGFRTADAWPRCRPRSRR